MNKYGAVFAVVVLGFSVLALPAVYDIAADDIKQRYVNESSTSIEGSFVDGFEDGDIDGWTEQLGNGNANADWYATDNESYKGNWSMEGDCSPCTTSNRGTIIRSGSINESVNMVSVALRIGSVARVKASQTQEVIVEGSG